MADQEQFAAEFDAVVDARGVVKIPPDVCETLNLRDGAAIRVRVTAKGIAEALRRNRVTLGEVEEIANLQLESPDQVVKFLMSEGKLASGKKRRRRIPV